MTEPIFARVSRVAATLALVAGVGSWHGAHAQEDFGFSRDTSRPIPSLPGRAFGYAGGAPDADGASSGETPGEAARRLQLKFKGRGPEESLARYMVRTMEDPTWITQRATTGALALGLDSLGVLEPAQAMLNYVGDKTTYQMGRCGQMKLRSTLFYESCFMDDEASVQFKSEYDLESIEVELKLNF